MYSNVHTGNTVPVLRDMVRRIGNKKWYTLRKANLVSVVIINRSAITITSFFVRVMERKRGNILRLKMGDGSRCPISLTPICDITEVFVHDGTVFSKPEIIEYLEVSIDFHNPITRNMFGFHDIQRLNNVSLEENYRNRVYLRDREVKAILQYSFLETELDNLLIGLTRLYYQQDSESFYNRHVLFYDTWNEMRSVDRNRTVCVVRSLMQSAQRFRGKPRSWAIDFIDDYLAKT